MLTLEAVTTTTSTSRQNGSATQPTPAVDYASIPEPSTTRKALGQSTSSKAASSSRKWAAALSAIAEDEYDDIDEHGESNMSMASVVDRNQAAESHAGRFSQEVDDDSGNEDFGYNGDDNDGGMDVDQPEQDPIPEPPWSEANDKAHRHRVETPSDEEMAESGIGRNDDDIPAPDDDDQFDVGGGYDDEPQQEEEEEPEPKESPRSKRARLAREKKEKEKGEG
ncbi:hypothetical protein FRC04_007225 [Tulasnella sp. 424]|nr:hypothetical protein FRC04_007225 [Tulasnella sp. 424]